MRQITIVLIVMLLGVSCKREIPENIIPQDQMERLLLDMHLADGQLASMVADSARIYRDSYYDAIFSRYAVDSTEFKHALVFYSTRPQLMKEIYVEIEKQLEHYNTIEQDSVTAGYNAKRMADSLVNARLTDSLQRVMRDSLDLKRKRYLLLLNGPDSVPYNRPIPVTHTLLYDRMMETIGLRKIETSSVLVQPDTVLVRPERPSAPLRQELDANSNSILKPFKKID